MLFCAFRCFFFLQLIIFSFVALYFLFLFCLRSKRLAWLFSPKKPAQQAIENKPQPAAITPKAAPPTPAPAPAPAAQQPAAKPSSSPPATPAKPAAAPAPVVAPKPAPVPAPAPVVAPKPAPEPTPAPAPVVTPKVSPPPQVVAPKPAPVTPPKDEKMPIPLPKSLTEANTNGNGHHDNGLEQKLFGAQLPSSNVSKIDTEQLKDASKDFIQGEAQSFVQSIKEAQQAGAR